MRSVVLHTVEKGNEERGVTVRQELTVCTPIPNFQLLMRSSCHSIAVNCYALYGIFVSPETSDVQCVLKMLIERVKKAVREALHCSASSCIVATVPVIAYPKEEQYCYQTKWID